MIKATDELSVAYSEMDVTTVAAPAPSTSKFERANSQKATQAVHRKKSVPPGIVRPGRCRRDCVSAPTRPNKKKFTMASRHAIHTAKASKKMA